MPYQANSVAAGGANASAFGPTAASTLHSPCFFSNGFSANGQDLEMASPSPAGASLPSHLASTLHTPHKFTISLTFGEGKFIIVVLYNS